MATITPDKSNAIFQLAVDLVNQSSRNIFLTGKAGTGKTTFLKYIRENCPKQMAVVAPTGVAAINAGGVTIHSFFQLPLSPFIPDAKGFTKDNDAFVNRNSLVKRLRITAEKKKVLQQLELLVIDEISMVRCDTVDAIDTVLRFIRKRPLERFGGVQVLFIGDMFQLPPVIKDAEWNFLSDFYKSPYFFESLVIKEEPPVYIEFNKIYRQSDETFIRLLNQVRNNELNAEGMKILESRFQPSFRRMAGDGYIILTTHNETARNINSGELTKLDGRIFTYKAEIEGNFMETAYPADDILHLKVGAQVMFIKNDLDKSKRYFNGKIGIVTRLSDETITVQCKGDTDGIEVSKVEWKNIRYTLNKESRQIDEELLGSFNQYPLRLAWAITIHKSQGLTFEKAIIDAGEAFARGQVYVALSRCTNLKGMVLQSKIRPDSLFTDQRILQFSKGPSDQLQQELLSSKRNYLEKLLLSTFDFRLAIGNANELMHYLVENRNSFNLETFSWLEEFLDKLNRLQETANKFQSWLQAQFQQPALPEENSVLLEKIPRASVHFIKELDYLIGYLQKSPAVTDSRVHAKEYNDSLKDVFAELTMKKHLLPGFDGRLDVEAWQKRKKVFVMPLFTVNAYAGSSQQRSETPHPILHQRLRKLRDAICAPRDIPIYIVAGSKTIDEMAQYLPQSLSELRKISGFGDAKIDQYGQDFLDVIVEYSRERGLSSLVHEKSPKRERKNTGVKKPRVDTKAESFKLYKEGKNTVEIAKERKLTVQTIESHLSYYVSEGDIHIDELVSREKIMLIEPALLDYEGGALTPIKEKLGNDISFGEIKLVLAWRQFQNKE